MHGPFGHVDLFRSKNQHPGEPIFPKNKHPYPTQSTNLNNNFFKLSHSKFPSQPIN